MLTPDPKYPELRRRRFRPIPVRMLVPNVITLLAICAGLTAIRLSIEGRMELAVAAIVFAAVLDGVDGRVARMIKGQSKFGAELDSLADFISFGVAPALVLYLWTMSALHSIGWAIVLFFAICCALRLARFNTEIAAEPQPYAAGFFSGVPAPGGAGLSLVPMFISFEWGDWIARSPYLNAVWLSGIALLMISRVPTVSLKPIRIPHDFVLPTLLGVGVFAGLFTTAPWPTLTFIGAIYVGSIPLTVRAYYRLRRAVEARKAEAAEPATIPVTPPPAIPLSGHEPANEWRH